MVSLHYTKVKGEAEGIINDILALDALSSWPEMTFTFHLVCEEIVSNVANYAYSDDTDGPLTIDVEETEDTLILTFTDRGKPFNPLAQTPPDTTLPPEERPIGGLGIFLVRQMMDEVAYHFADGCNVLVVSKNKG